MILHSSLQKSVKTDCEFIGHYQHPCSYRDIIEDMASIATASSFMGAAAPLGVGLTLGQWVQGARWKWALGLMGIGDLLAALGYKVGLS